jgi:aromatic ring hydroxylase
LGQITRRIDDRLAALSYKLSEQGQKLRGLLRIPTMVKDGSGKEYAEQRVNNILEMARGSGIAYLPQGEEFQELTNTYGTVSEVEMSIEAAAYQALRINEKLFTCDYSEVQYRNIFQAS